MTRDAGDGTGSEPRFCRPSALEGVSRRIARADPAGGALCFLVLSGSFSPVHTQHVVALEAVKAHLDGAGWQVMAGFLAPSSTDHVCEKIGDRGLPLAKRIELCELAVDHVGWIEVCADGERSSRWVTRWVREELERSCRHQLDGRELTGVEIMGTDTIVRLFDDTLAKASSADRAGAAERIVCYLQQRTALTAARARHRTRPRIEGHRDEADSRRTLRRSAAGGGGQLERDSRVDLERTVGAIEGKWLVTSRSPGQARA